MENVLKILKKRTKDIKNSFNTCLKLKIETKNLNKDRIEKIGNFNKLCNICISSNLKQLDWLVTTKNCKNKLKNWKGPSETGIRKEKVHFRSNSSLEKNPSRDLISASDQWIVKGIQKMLKFKQIFNFTILILQGWVKKIFRQLCFKIWKNRLVWK